ncbi:potassium-transporting ATPase subunit KdpC [Providencia hangzhouensis]|uniref:Potassium-transporting ATPase KdpC subunit n=1 Tax=Providencia rettgeri TaxID=587 RepID=A0AAJ4NH54_PRORE|nr:MULTISPECIES: potassium-transporting ATPase subunit KdpC [Providencia]MBJ9973347.1 potassium-transporting ATPase subunit KdpC [Providencia rettgeri]MCF8965129.1 Potassium-transporting ATPase KdpC subunit [Providencia rettgeri]QWQ15943.1 potassium-transporting ATPase subunit KdpC [Providencia rettgeri]QWQ19778.1 potassium-transporting ATPase subunit KdpC [Providencia rettgeri]QWQ23614.1 potassium-transporting ATPase subunit KdpC [Providencia rettgeri]
MNMIRSSMIMLFILTIFTGIAYPLMVTGLANIFFPWQAHGSLLMQDERTVGSALIGQNVDDARYFHGRPSSTIDSPYNTLASGGSNLAVSNPLLQQTMIERNEQLRAANPDADNATPVDLLTASASGLDPNISVDAALYQTPRIAKSRQIPLDAVKSLIETHTEQALLPFLGEPVINVLKLNLALDEYQQQINSQTH